MLCGIWFKQLHFLVYGSLIDFLHIAHGSAPRTELNYGGNYYGSWYFWPTIMKANAR